jgi:membrane protein implicated in regulation of membrane protease activity
MEAARSDTSQPAVTGPKHAPKGWATRLVHAAIAAIYLFIAFFAAASVLTRHPTLARFLAGLVLLSLPISVPFIIFRVLRLALTLGRRRRRHRRSC